MLGSSMSKPAKILQILHRPRTAAAGSARIFSFKPANAIILRIALRARGGGAASWLSSPAERSCNEPAKTCRRTKTSDCAAFHSFCLDQVCVFSRAPRLQLASTCFWAALLAGASAETSCRLRPRAGAGGVARPMSGCLYCGTICAAFLPKQGVRIPPSPRLQRVWKDVWKQIGPARQERAEAHGAGLPPYWAPQTVRDEDQ